jgi:hypothetical protein
VAAVIGLVLGLASCNSLDRRSRGDGPFAIMPPFVPATSPPPPFTVGPTPAGQPGFNFGSAGAGAFGAAGMLGPAGRPGIAAGSGGGGWQLLDGGTPPPRPSDDGGADDAG